MVARTMIGLPLNTSCTYRVHTNCGYPHLQFGSTELITDQYDIIYGTLDNLTTSEELNTWNFTVVTEQ